MDDRDDFNKMFRSTFHDLDEIIKEMDSTLRHFAFGGFSTMDCKYKNKQSIKPTSIILLNIFKFCF